MRKKDKILCDCCGKFIKKLTKKQMDIVMKDKKVGTRTNCSIVCKKCQDEKRMKILKALRESKKEITINITQKDIDEVNKMRKKLGFKPSKDKPHKLKALFG